MNDIKPKVLGGIGEKKSNGGKQWYQQDRIYDDNIAISVTTAFNPYYLIRQDNILTIKKGNNMNEDKKINVIGNYSPSGYDASRIVDNQGIAPTVKENHGTVTATIVNNLKTKNRRIKKLINATNFDGKNTLFMDIYNQRIKENVTGTLRSGMDQQQGNIIYNNLRIRKLTPKECWRLMGFDDEDFEKASKVNSNTQLYKQAGNSIVVNTLEAILKNLLLKNKKELKNGQTSIFDFI